MTINLVMVITVNKRLYLLDYAIPHKAVESAGVDCSLCNYSKGQHWLPNVDNCHLYYECVRSGYHGDYTYVHFTRLL